MKNLKLQLKTSAITMTVLGFLTQVSADGVKTCRGTQYGTTCTLEKTALSQSEILVLAVLLFAVGLVTLTVYKYFKANLLNFAK